MNLPKCSFIISVYKDTESLELILESLARQTIKPDEVIISEDGESAEMAQYFTSAKEKFSNLDLVHLSQEDIGWRKNIALNRAIMASKYDYLIFIDGDCVPFDTFVENHLLLAEQNIAIAGRRIEFSEYLSREIRKKTIDIFDITKHYFKNLPLLLKSKTRHLEEMLSINPKNPFYWLFRRNVNFLLGCNWSCFKSDLMKINGFDENFIAPTYGEDTDIAMRFKGIGIKLKSCRYSANLVHLYHKKNFNHEQAHGNYQIHQKSVEEKQYICLNGIDKY